MGRKRTTRQQLIDRCKSNVRHAEEIVANLQGVLGVYQEGSMENTLMIADSLQTAELFLEICKKTLMKVRTA